MTFPFVIVHEEHEWELEYPPAVEHRPFLSVPPLFFPDLLGDSGIPNFSCVPPSNKAHNVDHSQDTSDVSPSSNNERTNHSLKIHLIFHLLFPETQRVNVLPSHPPLCVIHRIMRMPTNILTFLILVVVISSPHHPITMLIHSLLICLSHWSTKFHRLTKSKPHILSRNFSLS